MGGLGRGQQLAVAEIKRRVGSHHGHCGEGLAVVVRRVPKEKSDAALLLGDSYLRLYVFRRIARGAPAESLQPRTNHYAGARRNLFKALHRYPDEVLRSVAGPRV